MPKRNNSIIFTNGYETAVEYKGYGKRISGVIYSVIPPNDALLAISPDQDIWLGFSYLAAETGLEDLDDFNNSILMFLAFFYKFIRNKDLIDKIEASEYEAFKTLKDILSEEIFIVNKLKNIFTKPGKSLIVNMFNEIDKLLADERARNIILPIYEKYANDNPFPNTGEYIIEQKTLNPNISILSILDKLLDPEENGFALIQYALFLENTFPISEIWTDKPCVFIDINDPNLLAELYMKYNRLKKGKEV